MFLLSHAALTRAAGAEEEGAAQPVKLSQEKAARAGPVGAMQHRSQIKFLC